ncbi:c-type cytochrome [Mesorhizobium xinjiangense]|uniref:c-type cytochrome n=1 Tax=Mesorhizobium xinjiangense TaxID=2678685 RepID=UPI0012EED6ED|nr:cytochrome c family protein [Mesorhizobium xinjiangense]
MDSFELNKLLGGLLGAAFVVFSIGIVSDSIFASPAPEKPGFEVVAAEPEEGGAADEGPSVEPIAVRLASADASAGEAVFKKCVACHTAENGGANKVGPNLWNIVNRPIASHEGFSYSGGMTEFSEDHSVHWDYEHLDHFLEGPRNYVKGTAMAFAGVKRPEERANLIAYLRTLSDDPAPLPEVEEPEAAEAATGEDPAAAQEAAPEGEQPAAEEPAANGDDASTDAPAETQETAPEAEEPAAQ